MVVTNDTEIAQKVFQLKGQGQDLKKRYWFPIIGYNYRMTNIQAALGLAQIEKADWHISRHRENAAWYREFLGESAVIALQPEQPWAKNVYWMNSLLLKFDSPIGRDELAMKLLEKGIETRPFFYPMHILPPYQTLVAGQYYPIADLLSRNGLNLPSSADLTKSDIEYIANTILKLLGQ